MKIFRALTAVVALALVALSLGVADAGAQSAGVGSGLRAFKHVFLAMTAAWAILGLWIWFMAAKLSRLVREEGRADTP